MQEDTRKKPRKRRKKSKFGYYLYAVVILVLTIANVFLAFALLTHVQNITVTGNELSNTNEVIAWIKEDSMTNNSIYTWWKFNYGTYEKPVYLEKVDVSLQAPWKIKVKVQEKKIVAGAVTSGEYVYFDEDGLVLKIESENTKEVPLVEGIETGKAKRFHKLAIEDKDAFACAIEISKELVQSGLTPDRLIWEENGINLHFGEVHVKMGKMNFHDKVVQLPPILAELEGENGVLNLEFYSSENKKISFEKNE